MNAPTTVTPTGVSVRQDARTAAVVALLAAVLTVAWFARALGTADPLDWLWCLVPAAVGLLQLLVVRDARAPMLVAADLQRPRVQVHARIAHVILVVGEALERHHVLVGARGRPDLRRDPEEVGPAGISVGTTERT